MKFLLINQPLNNRGDESAHRALTRRILNDIPNSEITALFFDEKQDSVNQFKVDSERVCYKLFLPTYLGKNKLWRFFYSRVIVGCFFFKFLKITYYYNLFPLWFLNPLLWPLIIEIKKADLVLNAPGGICMGGFQSWHHIAYLKLSLLLRKQVFYYGRSIGPFPEATNYNIRFKEASVNLLNSFSFLALRDEKSEVIAQTMDVSYISTVDSAFLNVPVVPIPDTVLPRLKKSYIVFVPNVLRWHYAYQKVPKERIDRMYTSMISILQKKYPSVQIVMMPQTFNYDDSLWNDVNYFKEIKELMNNSADILVLDDKYSSDVQQTIIRGSSLVVGARYHSIIFAINNKVPFVSLSYEHKMEGLLKTIGATSQMVDIKDLSSEDSVDSILRDFCSIDCFGDVDTLYHRASSVAENCFGRFVAICSAQQS